MIAENKKTPAARYGMTIDLDRCTGCGACMVACAVENNVPPAAAAATERTGITWIRVFKIDNGADGADRRSAFVPMLCQQCGKDTPCVSVCPQQAVEVDPATGIVGQMPERCLGCRYCMAACPYHARYFNWWDPGLARRHGEDAEPRRRSAHARRGGEVQLLPRPLARRQEPKPRPTARPRIDPADYVPACVEACPTGAIRFGDLNDAGQPKPPGSAQSPTASACWNSSAPSPRSTTAPRRTGCAKSPARPRPRPRKGEPPWMTGIHHRAA